MSDQVAEQFVPIMNARSEFAVVRVLRALGRSLISPTSGMTLLWLGWAMIVFFVVIWLLLPESELSSRAAHAILLLAMLGQCAIVTGVGLAVMDTLSADRRPRHRRTAQSRLLHAAPSNGRLGSPPTERWVLLGGRLPALMHVDGTVDVATRVGWRRFASQDDAYDFVGMRWARSMLPMPAGGNREKMHETADRPSYAPGRG